MPNRLIKILPILYIIYLSTLSAALSLADDKYIAVVDAGSSGMRLNIYEQDGDDLKSIQSVSNNFSLDKYIYKPDEGYVVVKDLLSKIYHKSFDIKDIPIYVYATAGMRYTPLLQQNILYDNIRDNLKKDGYKSFTIKTISGADEALYGWIAVNYLHGTLGTKETLGALDMGGASTEIAFEVSDMKDSNKVFHYKDKSHYLYAKSFFGLGQDKVRESVTSLKKTRQVCYSNGYWPIQLTGRGNYKYSHAECKSILSNHLANSDYKLNETRIIAEKNPTTHFIALSAFYHIAEFFLRKDNLQLSNLKKTTINLCQKDWEHFV